MSDLRARIELRDRGSLETFDLAFAFFRVHWRAYARLSLVTLPVVVIAGAWASAGHFDLLRWVVAASLAIAVDAAFTLLASKLVFDDAVSGHTVLREALRRWPALLFVRAIGLFAVLAASLLIVPGIILWVRWAFLTEAFLLERVDIGHAFSRSSAIAGPDATSAGFVAFGLPIVQGLFGLAVASAMTALTDGLLQAPSIAEWVAAARPSFVVVGVALSIPLVATTRLLVYIGLRAKTEGWDVQAAAVGLRARLTEPATAPIATRASGEAA